LEVFIITRYTIHQISEMFSLPSSTLRHYEDVGRLTNVAKTDPANKYTMTITSIA